MLHSESISCCGGYRDAEWNDSPSISGLSAGDAVAADELSCRRGAIVGRSEKWLNAIESIRRVAPSDLTALISGETGTGKELAASLLHECSGRAAGPFVRVDCSSIVDDLFESELFGHERGSFTGAIARRQGRVELAEGGTLFLDEIGELPMRLQQRLLRLIQEKEYEQVGSSRTRRADIRIVAATNVRLQEAISSGRFRSDLYFRLASYPIHLPPLRERPEDIILLARHFLKHASGRSGRSPVALTLESMRVLSEHVWPGNVRELRNVVERLSVSNFIWQIQARELTFDGPIAKDGAEPAGRAAHEASTYQEAAKQCVLGALKATHGIIEGDRGAAKLLGLPSSTVRFKMRKLKISRADCIGSG